jgi:intracellular septation protein
MKATGRRVDAPLWVSLALVVELGGATVWFHSETFIKWKPSVLYWFMGLTLWVAHTLFRRNLLKVLMGEQLDLPAVVWQRLNFAWVAFFAFMGLLNIYVAYSFSTDTWVDFKLFGGIGLMLVFTVGQGVYLSRHLRDTDSPASDPAKPAP